MLPFRLSAFVTIVLVLLFVAAPAGPIDGFGIGSAHVRLGKEGIGPLLDLQQKMGIGYAREELPWELVGQGEGQFSWIVPIKNGPTLDFHYALDELARRGIKPVMILDYGPRFLQGDPNANYHVDPAAFLRLWRDYVQHAVAEFGDQIDYWEIGNEMNSRNFWGKVVTEREDDLDPKTAAPDGPAEPEPELYAQMLAIAYDIIKESARSDTVIMGGLVDLTDGDCATSPYEFLRRVNAAGAWRSFDAIAIHPYWGANAPETYIDRGADHDPLTGACRTGQGHYNQIGEVRAIRDLAARFGAKPLWITEVGWNQVWLEQIASWRGLDPDLIEADYLARTYVPLLAEPGVAAVMWYTLVDDPGAAGEDFALDPPGQRVLANLSHFLSGSQSLGQVQGRQDRGAATDDDVYEYRFRKGNQTTIVAWKARGGDAARAVTLRNLPGDDAEWQVFAADAASLESPKATLTATDGQLSLALTERPLLLVQQGAAVSDPAAWWSRLLETVTDWWDGVRGDVVRWFDERGNAITGGLENWWSEQMAKLSAAFDQFVRDLEQKASQAFEQQIEQFMQQLCGTASLPAGLACVLVITRRTRRRPPGV